MSEGEKLLEHDGDLDTVGRRQRVELVRMHADGQILFMGRTGDRPVNAGEPAAGFFRRFPDLGGRVGITHIS
jgi:hypothetical protein